MTTTTPTTTASGDRPARHWPATIQRTEMGAWVQRGECRNHDPELWFPVATSEEAAAAALAICDVCPVFDECRAWALANREPDGIWGGLTSRDRTNILRRGRTPLKRQQLAVGEACADKVGTNTGYGRHAAAGEAACKPCRDAASAYVRARKAARVEAELAAYEAETDALIAGHLAAAGVAS